jgi:hypothetical protein
VGVPPASFQIVENPIDQTQLELKTAMILHIFLDFSMAYSHLFLPVPVGFQRQLMAICARS